jgi:hypothetical protein
MTIENGIRVLAGTLVLAGLAIGWWLSPYGYLLSAFVAVNLIQSAFTGFCPAVKILARLGLRESGGCGCQKP